MGEFIRIAFGASTAVPKAVEYDRAMVIGDATPSTLSESKVYELSPSNWQTQLEADGFALGDQLYDSISIFFGANPSPQRVWAYAYLSGAATTYTDVPLSYVGDEMWEIPIKPPNGFYNNLERVRFYCCGDDIGSGYTWNYADGSQGLEFTPETDNEGDWTGRITFDNGLSGAVCGIVDPLTTDCKITCDFVIGSQGGISEALNDYQINMVSLSLENNANLKNFDTNIFGSQLQDIMMMRSLIAGKKCMWIYCLPGDADPDDTIQGSTSTWEQFKNLVGSNDHIAPIKAKPSSSNDDMAAGYMSMIVISHPHQQLTFAVPHMGIEEQENAINRSKWKTAQIACIMKWTELTGEPFLIRYGFTLGQGDTSRVEGTRCRDILAQTLENNLKGLLAKRSTWMSYEGVQKIKAVIRGTFKALKDKQIVDGLKSIYVPLEDDLLNNTAAGQLANALQEVTISEIQYYWNKCLEKITITKIENVAT